MFSLPTKLVKHCVTFNRNNYSDQMIWNVIYKRDINYPLCIIWNYSWKQRLEYSFSKCFHKSVWSCISTKHHQPQSFLFKHKQDNIQAGRELKSVWDNICNIPAIDVPQFFSTPSTAAAMALPFSTDLSIRAIASYKHFAISRSAITSPFSTTGRCLNLPTIEISRIYIKQINNERAKKKVWFQKI